MRSTTDLEAGRRARLTRHELALEVGPDDGRTAPTSRRCTVQGANPAPPLDGGHTASLPAPPLAGRRGEHFSRVLVVELTRCGWSVRTVDRPPGVAPDGFRGAPLTVQGRIASPMGARSAPRSQP
jgi:hypothetical protein